MIRGLKLASSRNPLLTSACKRVSPLASPVLSCQIDYKQMARVREVGLPTRVTINRPAMGGSHEHLVFIRACIVVDYLLKIS